MLSLVGGELYQWDTGRVVKVVPDENVTVHEVHFSTKRMDYAYVLKTYVEDGVTYCAIPNIILQQSNRLLCYEVCQNSDGEETIADTYFDIIKRNRPEDYVYTEQEHFTIQNLSDRVDKLEESNHTHANKTELDTITEEDLETWRNPNSSAVTGGAQVGTLFKDLEVTTTLAEDASEWTSAFSQPFKCTFRPSPGQMVYASVEGLGVPYMTTAKISPTGLPLGKTIVGNYSVVNSRLKTWYNDADDLPPTPNDTGAEWCLVFEDQDYDPVHCTPNLPACTLYTKTPGTYKVTVTTMSYSIDFESILKMYDIRPSTFAEYGTYANWKDLTKSGKYDFWEVGIKNTDYYIGAHLKEVDGTKYIYVYRSEQKEDPDSGTFVNTDYTLTYDTATETVTCSDATINPETDVIISVHLDTIISTVPDKATSLGQPTPDKVGKMLTAVDHGEGAIDNKFQSRRYEYQWVDAPTGSSKDAVTYTKQTLTDVQKKQARDNIGAISKLEPLIVTFTSDGSGNWSTDKKFAEVKEAIEAGQFVQGMCDDGSLSVYMCTEEMIGFSYSVCLPEEGITLIASMVSSGEVFCDTMQNNYFDSNNLESKTDTMAQPVGVDSDGKLWTEIPTKTSQLTNDSGYLTEHQSLEAYAKKTEIPTVPTKVSAFENDSGYLTEHQSLADYAKKTEIPTVPSTDTALSDSSTNPVQNKIIKAELDKKLESIPVDGTTIKLNDQGQLTLALSNANGVNF